MYPSYMITVYEDNAALKTAGTGLDIIISGSVLDLITCIVKEGRINFCNSLSSNHRDGFPTILAAMDGGTCMQLCGYKLFNN